MARKPRKPKKPIRAHCPNCGPDKYAHIVREFTEREYADDDETVWADTTGRILQCGGCKKIYFQEVFVFSEDITFHEGPGGEPIEDLNERITYFPAPSKRERPDWLTSSIDSGLRSLLEETYRSLDADAPVLAATGARTIFDRASELLEIDPALTFQEKLDELQAKGNIGRAERGNLDVLTDAGGAAAHRGWKPTPIQLDTIMNILESFIHRTFVLAAEVDELKAQIPPKQKRKKK